ncbi:mitochondrial CCA tRNA nucleotidyltransferase [Chloropicon roscoffensis]|uniref:Mitochondrial CCA tRNA nucleotidyltransferase n=2 Tax=Chloropicon roscoffensis TaxID=1461544 RepID=A0AAX4P1F8_9CHLO
MAVELNAEELELFGVLRNVVRDLNLSTELRCAGGWVRDKLLGRESDDIDIALDNMSGETYANHLNDYLASRGEEQTSVAVIQSNPEQSKHLETAKVKYQGLEIDFVNLRSESYASSSRIPEIEFGTAEEDAMRRDFTINALFYNIGQGNVEDLTGRGLEDLRNKLIRTPLPALQTFMDDPLRVLRAVRFASRFSFEIHHDIAEAASSAEVRDALQTKVSRERISTEFESMLEGPNPKLALQLIKSFGLLDAVLNVPQSLKEVLPVGYAERCIGAGVLMADLLAGKWDKATRRIGVLSALLLPLRGFSAQGEKKNREVPLPEYVVGVSMKKKKDAVTIGALHRAALDILAVSQDTCDPCRETKVKFGLAIRSTRELWRVATLLSFVAGLPLGRSLHSDSEEDSPRITISPAEEALDRSAAYTSKVEQLAVSLKLERAWEIRPLINGKELMKLLNAKGPVIGKAVQEMTKWQLANPGGSVEDCKVYLQERTFSN